ncbi:BLOC-1-related complex subunit 6-like [Cricetulus griseus]|uniref:BLOC-1 related complex subunit 6 n=1 Tax=Cricetulus griseus TaxID=10029 RepID=A0A8C2LCX5_CRIGR|nr:BLOC-1-related complex subunit 6-like [Cricetulus griseus]
MEAAPGRLGPEPDPSAAASHQAATSSGKPVPTPSKPPSALTVPGELEEAENVGVASRHPRASPRTSSGSVVHRPEPDAWEDQPGIRATPSGPGDHRGPAGSEHAPAPSSWHREPEPEPGENQPSAPRACRRGSPGGVEMSVEPPLQETEDRNGEEAEAEAEAAGRAGRSFPSRLQDSRSLDGLSGACGGGASSVGGEAGAGGGRRATISSPLELEGTVSRHGDLTHFVANNLQLKIRLSAAPPPLPPASARPCLTPAPTPTIPPIDPDVLRDLERLSRDLGGRVDRLLRGLGGAVQELTALSVGCIQTYRDAVDSLGEAVDMSIKGMYTLLARCEELERALQPVQGLARQVRDIRRTLEVLEALCK